MPGRTRKILVSTLAAAVLAVGALADARSGASARPTLDVWKTATCGCCGGWVRHMIAAGFEVRVHEVEELDPIRRAKGVPEPLTSCHTAEVEGYVVEGHVPAADVARLLAERPPARGLSAPGMPLDAPGMDLGTNEPYQVLLFGGPDGAVRVYARH